MQLLVKTDPELGYAYFCSACKHFVCGGERCWFCREPFDWTAEKIPYNGKVKWPTVTELSTARRKEVR